jgi:NADH-quinone oxidoreductase subunit L
MSWITRNLWLIPALPMLAAGLGALAPRRRRGVTASLAIGSMAISLLLSLCALAHAVTAGGAAREVYNFAWFELGSDWVRLGWVLDPLSAVMLFMVTFVGLLIFIFSTGYMAHDANFARFFVFLALFAGAMLGVVIANSLLLLFVCWEVVGLTSYLLIGFWFHKPSAAAAAKKAFITTRVGDVALLIGMVWLYGQTGTLLFYDGGAGCVEPTALAGLTSRLAATGLLVSTGIGLLIFAGAAGKSGQVPLHVWLPDAMEGPTPVSALIHAATMVAAGVYLVARVYPLMAAHPGAGEAATTALQVITWVGAITAVFAATIAVAQNDIKRILAYSTVSQLGYMMMGLGVGGVAVGMFHLITHAFFKALLFLGAGSVIHGCHEEQDIRRMGGLRKYMPVTFAAYAVGMLALAGFPLLFSGFWSKDEILHSAHAWPVSQIPFYLGVIGAFLTAFYMTRQVFNVFFGANRLAPGGGNHGAKAHGHNSAPHESPTVMTAPLVILAACSVLLGFLGTPVWPWFQTFLGGGVHEGGEGGVIPLMLLSTAVVFLGLGFGWFFYGKTLRAAAKELDPLEAGYPGVFRLLQNKYYFDELYEATIIRFNAVAAKVCDLLDRIVWNGAIVVVSYLAIALAWVSGAFDNGIINAGFDRSCRGVNSGGQSMAKLQTGRLQGYLTVIGVALVAIAAYLAWGGKR